MTGTGSAGRDDSREDTSSSEPSNSRLYKWRCPYCEKFGIQIATPEDVERYVVNAVRSHVRSTNGNGHGPRREFPPGEDVEAAIQDHLDVVGSED